MLHATFCDVLHETNKIRKQTLESAQNELEIFKTHLFEMRKLS